jgi:hypothetical protein
VTIKYFVDFAISLQYMNRKIVHADGTFGGGKGKGGKGKGDGKGGKGFGKGKGGGKGGKGKGY